LPSNFWHPIFHYNPINNFCKSTQSHTISPGVLVKWSCRLLLWSYLIAMQRLVLSLLQYLHSRHWAV
jgi:hypothetical protein